MSTEIKADLTDTIKEVSTNALEKPTKEVGNILGTTLGFLHNTVLYPMQKYNIYAQNKLNEYAKELENKIEEIPSEKLVEASVNILGPTMEGLKYNLDEEHIKNMFTNILAADMNIDTKNKVHPSYIETVKQLNAEDAIFLQNFMKFKTKSFCSIELKLVSNEDKGYSRVGRAYYLHEDADTPIRLLDPIVVDNLSRLNLIDVQYDEYFVNNNKYDLIFEELSKKLTVAEKHSLEFDKGILKLTDYGKNFVEICIGKLE